MAKIATTTALHHFHWQYATLVLFNSTLICGVDIFLRSYQKNVYVGRGIFHPSFAKKIRQYVIFGTDLVDIAHMLTWMRKHQLDNTGRFIVVCQSERWDNCNEGDLVNLLWNNKIINVVCLSRTRQDESISTFTYYHPEDCMNPHPIYLENWDACLVNGPCQNMYPLKLTNLHQCPLVVSTFNQVPYMNLTNDPPTGADGDLLRVIATAMNFTFVTMTPRIGYGWGKVDNNGSWTGSLADVDNEWANFSMTYGCITMIRFNNFQISRDYAVIRIGWVSHPSEILPSSLKLFRPFQSYVRIALGISFVMVILFKISLKSTFLSSFCREMNIALPDDIVFHSWELCMGLPVRSFPTNKSLLCLAVIWIWYCFLIRTLYQGQLINSLKTDVYDPEIDSIEEAIATKYTFGGGLPLRDYFVDNSLIFDGWKNIESVDIPPTMVELTEGLKFVLAMNIETTKVYLSSNPGKKLHILPRAVVSSPTAIFFKKYSPIADSMNMIISRLRESGIIQKIHNDNAGVNEKNDAKDDNIPINMVHYTGCYAILLIGWLLSSSCFIIEKVIVKKRST